MKKKPVSQGFSYKFKYFQDAKGFFCLHIQANNYQRIFGVFFFWSVVQSDTLDNRTFTLLSATEREKKILKINISRVWKTK